jgi:hypothetical protein
MQFTVNIEYTDRKGEIDKNYIRQQGKATFPSTVPQQGFLPQMMGFMPNDVAGSWRQIENYVSIQGGTMYFSMFNNLEHNYLMEIVYS